METSIPSAPAEPVRPRVGWARLGSFAATFLGAVFLVSVLAKVFDVNAFAETIHARGLDAVLPATAVAYIALALETFVGVLLVLNVRRLGFLLLVAALVAFLLWINLDAYLAWSKGASLATTACGCFGNLVQRTPAEALWQDTLLVLPALLLSFVGRPRGETTFLSVRVGLAVAATVLVLLTAWFGPRLPVDDWRFVTRLYPRLSVQALCVGKGEAETCLVDDDVAPELASGRHVVVLADLSDASFAEAIRGQTAELRTWDEDPARAPLFVIHAGTEDDEVTFYARTEGAPLEVRRASYPLLRSMVRRLPRTFVVDDGVVLRTWDGLPRLAETTAP